MTDELLLSLSVFDFNKFYWTSWHACLFCCHKYAWLYDVKVAIYDLPLALFFIAFRDLKELAYNSQIEKVFSTFTGVSLDPTAHLEFCECAFC